MIKRHTIAFVLVLYIAPFFTGALELGDFPAEDRLELNKGSAIIRSRSRFRDLVIAQKEQHPFMTSLRGMKPNYIAEAFILIPGDNTARLLAELSLSLGDFESWKGIPYWSTQQETWYDLFSEATVEEERIEGNKTSWTSSFVMEPFTRYRTKTDIILKEDSLVFNSLNEDEISYAYNGMRAIKKHNMHWFVEAELVEEGLLVYGVGAVYAFDMFGVIRNRLEASLVGRMRAFFSWQFDRLLPKDSE